MMTIVIHVITNIIVVIMNRQCMKTIPDIGDVKTIYRNTLLRVMMREDIQTICLNICLYVKLQDMKHIHRNIYLSSLLKKGMKIIYRNIYLHALLKGGMKIIYQNINLHEHLTGDMKITYQNTYHPAILIEDMKSIYQNIYLSEILREDTNICRNIHLNTTQKENKQKVLIQRFRAVQ